MSEQLYVLFLGTAGALGVVLFLLACRIARRRRGLPYLLIAVALGALAGRSMVGLAEFAGLIDFGMHHLLEHGLDALIALTLFAAVVAMGRPDSSGWRDPEP